MKRVVYSLSTSKKYLCISSDVVTFELLQVYFNQLADECLMTRCYDIIFIKEKFLIKFFSRSLCDNVSFSVFRFALVR